MVMSCVALNQSAIAYRIASSWTSTSLKAINLYPGNYGTVHFHHLPSQYRGGFIFRLGIEDALRWICPNVQFDSIQIHSTQEIYQPVALSIEKDLPGANISHKNSDSKKTDLHISWTQETVEIKKVPSDN
jgi:hypothetical protein